jgi:hypothetical protein
VTESVQETDNKGRPVRREVTRTVEDRIAVALRSSRVEVGLKLQHRQKGLLWYDTYTVDFGGKYPVRNPDDQPRTLTAEFRFPSAEAIYDGFVFRLAGQDAPKGSLAQAVSVSTVLPAHGEADLLVAYRSRGLDDWTYAFAPEGVSNVQDFALAMTTDFRRIDFPAGTVSPTTYLRRAAGLRSTVREAAVAQFVYLVLFSYAFFFEGYTGLTVTIGAVLTLFVLMQITARVDWGEVFARPGATPSIR